jgi:hypothetical protein
MSPEQGGHAICLSARLSPEHGRPCNLSVCLSYGVLEHVCQPGSTSTCTCSMSDVEVPACVGVLHTCRMLLADKVPWRCQRRNHNGSHTQAITSEGLQLFRKSVRLQTFLELPPSQETNGSLHDRSPSRLEPRREGGGNSIRRLEPVLLLQCASFVRPFRYKSHDLKEPWPEAVRVQCGKVQFHLPYDDMH